MLKITYKNGAFFANDQKGTQSTALLAAGFKFNKVNGWFTTRPQGAFRLREHGDESVQKILSKLFIHYKRWSEAPLIPKGLKLLKHQPGAINYSLSRNRSYLALRPGLGKTPVAALIASSMNSPTVVVVPPFLAMNTEEEFKKWNPKMSVKILDNVDWEVPDVLIIPDSVVDRIENYEYIKRVIKPKLFVIDEAHRFKNDKAGRTGALLGKMPSKANSYKYEKGLLDINTINNIVYMSGYPMPNRPIELFPILNKSFPEFIDFNSRKQYVDRFCAGHFNGFGVNENGCNHAMMKILSEKMISKDADDPNGFMLRIEKSVLGLKEYLTEVIILSEDMSVKLRELDMKLLREYSPMDMMKFIIAKKQNKDEIHLSTYRRLLGVHKVKASVEFITDILEETSDNILIFAIHKEVIAELDAALSKYEPLTVKGSSKVERHNLVKEFQSNTNKRVFIGNIDAIGVGLTLTKADRIVFVEYSWVPGINQQAIDRVHRYGLDHDLLVQFLTFRNSIDKTMLEVNERKKRVIAHV